MIMADPIAETNELIKTSSSTIKSLGPITVAFFILLLALLFVGWMLIQTQATLATDTNKDVNEVLTAVGKLDTKVSDSMVRMAEATEQLLTVQAQTCMNTSKTDQQRQGCIVHKPFSALK